MEEYQVKKVGGWKGILLFEPPPLTPPVEGGGFLHVEDPAYQRGKGNEMTNSNIDSAVGADEEKLLSDYPQ